MFNFRLFLFILCYFVVIIVELHQTLAPLFLVWSRFKRPCRCPCATISPQRSRKLQCTCSSPLLGPWLQYPRNIAQCPSIRALRQSARGTRSLGLFFLLSHCCLVSTYAEKETSLPLPPSAAASNLPSLFFSPLPLACALPVKRFLFTGELSSNSSETSGCRSSRRSARLLRLSCHRRLLWKAVESESSCFSRWED